MQLVKQDGLGIAGVIGMLWAFGVGACGDDFTSDDCRVSHTCPEQAGGAAPAEGGAGPSGSGEAGSDAMEAGGNKPGSGDAGSGAVEGPGGNGGSSASGCTAAEECDNGDPTDGEEICDDDGVCAPGNPPPTVVSISPEAGVAGVDPDTTVVITFSEPLDGTTVTGESVRLFDGDTLVEGEPTYADSKVTFTPAAPLALLADYSVAITTAVTDVEGAPLLDEHMSAFTTRDGAWSSPIDAATGYIYLFPRVLPVDGKGNVLVSWIQRSTTSVYCPTSARWFNLGAALGLPTSFIQGQGIYECSNIAAAVNAEGAGAVAWSEDEEQEYLVQYRAGAWPATATEPVSSRGANGPYGVGVAPSGAVSFLQHSSTTGSEYTTYARRTNANGAWVGAWADIAAGHVGVSVPRIVFDDESNGFAAWGSEVTGIDEVLVARYTAADGWKQAAPLPGSPAGSTSANEQRGAPAIAVDDGGGAVALWLREDLATASGSMVSSRFTASGGWEDPVIVSGTLSVVDMLEAPGLVFDGHNYVAAWTATDGYVYSAVYDVELGEWASYEPRSSAGVYMGMPGLGVDAHGNVMLTWLQGAQVPLTLRFARYDAQAGAWSDAQAIPGGTLQKSVDTAFGVGPSGHAAIIWTEPDTQGAPAKLRLASFY
jgi:hypothetical protein